MTPTSVSPMRLTSEYVIESLRGTIMSTSWSSGTFLIMSSRIRDSLILHKNYGQIIKYKNYLLSAVGGVSFFGVIDIESTAFCLILKLEYKVLDYFLSRAIIQAHDGPNEILN